MIVSCWTIAMKVYLAAPMAGVRSNLEINKKVYAFLVKLGHEVLTEHVVRDRLDVELGLSPKEIFERDVKLLDACDVVVADASYPSLGVGFEIAYALLKGKKVIAYCSAERVEKTSALIRGISWPIFKFITYSSPVELLEKLKRVLTEEEAGNGG